MKPLRDLTDSQGCLRRLDDEVKVVFHQAVCVDGKTRFLARLGQGLQEVLTIDIIQKNGFLAIPAAQDVINGPFLFDSELSRHEPHPAPASQEVKRNWDKAIVWGVIGSG